MVYLNTKLQRRIKKLKRQIEGEKGCNSIHEALQNYKTFSQAVQYFSEDYQTWETLAQNC